MIPPARYGGRKRSVNVHEVLNGNFYVLWTGCQWKALPKDLPPKSTVHDYLDLWNWGGTLERIQHALYVAVWEQEEREARPPVTIMDSQTAKGAQKEDRLPTLRATTRASRIVTAPCQCCVAPEDCFRSVSHLGETRGSRDRNSELRQAEIHHVI
jgi:transposase